MDLLSFVPTLAIVSWLIGLVYGEVMITIQPETPQVGDDVYVSCKYNDDRHNAEPHAIWWSRVNTLPNGTRRYHPLATDVQRGNYSIVTLVSKSNTPMKSILKIVSVSNMSSDWYACSVWTSEGSESSYFYLPVMVPTSTMLSTLVMIAVIVAGVFLFGWVIMTVDDSKFWSSTRRMWQQTSDSDSDSDFFPEESHDDSDSDDTPPRYSVVVNDPRTFSAPSIFSIANTALGRESRVVSCALPTYDEALLDLMVEVEPNVKVKASAAPPPSYDDLVENNNRTSRFGHFV